MARLIKNLYKKLGVRNNASQKELYKAYQRHRQHFQGQPTEYVRGIVLAYYTLSNRKKKRDHDQENELSVYTEEVSWGDAEARALQEAEEERAHYMLLRYRTTGETFRQQVQRDRLKTIKRNRTTLLNRSLRVSLFIHYFGA